jgi:hypothetical protein
VTFREVWDISNRVMDNYEASLDPEIKRALQEYENPRGLPEGWCIGYLKRPKLQLALDVMRAYDQNHQLKRQIKSCKAQIAAMTTILVIALKVIEHFVK